MQYHEIYHTHTHIGQSEWFDERFDIAWNGADRPSCSTFIACSDADEKAASFPTLAFDGNFKIPLEPKSDCHAFISSNIFIFLPAIILK